MAQGPSKPSRAYVPTGAPARESPVSATAWPAVIGGALVAVAVTIFLLALGSGMGFAAVSPWGGNPSAVSFGIMAGIWLIIVQWISAGLGGYLTGRLRTKWTDAHTHEVVFRDTANGLLTWALATVIVAAFTVSAGKSALSGATQAAATAVSGAASGAGEAARGAAQGALQPGQAGEAGQAGPGSYLMDQLFRPAQPSAQAEGPAPLAEAAGIIAHGLAEGSLAPADRTYLAQLVAARTGLSQPDAEKRIDEVMAKAKAAADTAKEAADEARKAASAFGFFTALSMLIGAFIAAVAAALGGRQRDAAPQA